MTYVMSQLGGSDPLFNILYFILFIGFFFFYPRLMLSQIMFKLERTANDLEDMSARSKQFLIHEVSRKPDKSLKESINRFFEFFVIAPADLDPAGLVKRFDHIITHERTRFNHFVRQIAPAMTSEQQANLSMGLAGGMTLHQVAKIVRHYVELIRKTKSYQIAVILQMQMPMVERMAKSLYSGTKALARGNPIGDGLGPLVVATLIGSRKVKETEDEIVMARVPRNGRTLVVLKAKGPGGRIGTPGKAVQKVVNTVAIAKIISIDAAAKLEGEKTGSIAEGVGVAMGGPGVERSYIEAIAVEQGIPLDSIIVKMSQEEAITPMKKEIKDAVAEVMASLDRSLETTRKGSTVVVVGVGNTSGVGNSAQHARAAEEWVNAYHRKMQARKKKGKKSSDDE